jgi:prevent-host-death family protein
VTERRPVPAEDDPWPLIGGVRGTDGHNLTKLVNLARLSLMPRKRGVRETVSLYEAKTQLSRLVDRAAAGEEIVIAKSGRPRARLVPLEDTRPMRVPGKGKGRWRVGKDFDAALPDDLVEGFEGVR